jgi:hypothetical protein
MATSFKTFSNNDMTTTRTLLHEAIPMTGAIFSGTYQRGEHGAHENIKSYAHGMFQSVYDYPYLSSSANHILDITFGYSSASQLSSAGGNPNTNTQHEKKVNIYNSMAQILMGYDIEGRVRRFDRDGSLNDNAGKMNDLLFVNFARLITKDEVKKGSFEMTVVTGGLVTTNHEKAEFYVTIQDTDAQNSFFNNSPAGEYGILYTSSANVVESSGVGLVFYQAGIVCLTSSLFATVPSGSQLGLGATHQSGDRVYCSWGDPLSTIKHGTDDNGGGWSYTGLGLQGDGGLVGAATGSTIDVIADGLRNRIRNIQFNNTTELNSTIYFCRANHNDFNYSSNPTYLSSSKLVVKNSSLDNPVTYITTVGMYSADNELLAVAKLSEPLKKDPTNELTLRVRLDY